MQFFKRRVDDTDDKCSLDNIPYGPEFVRRSQADFIDNVKVIFSWVWKIALSALILLSFTVFLINAEIPSGSMENTIMTGDRIFGNRLAYNGSKSPKRYDVVIFEDPTGSGKYLIKRVIGLPGDTLVFKDGDVYLKDESEPLDDSFCKTQHSTGTGLLNGNTVYVPEGCYFVMGDNRGDSLDSRYWVNKSGEPIPYIQESDIIAKAAFRYYPFNKICFIK